MPQFFLECLFSRRREPDLPETPILPSSEVASDLAPAIGVPAANFFTPAFRGVFNFLSPRSRDDAGAASIDGAGAKFKDGAGAASIDGAGAAFIDGAGAVSIDGAGAESIDGAGAEKNDDAGLTSFSSVTGGVRT